MAKSEVRTADERDASRIAALASELGRELDAASAASHLRALSGRGCVLVAEREGRVIGWVEAAETSALGTPRTALVSGLVVEREHRGSGAGRHLVAAVAAWAHERGAERLLVRARTEREEAHGFYRALGFELTKTQRVLARPLAPSSDPPGSL